MASSNGNIFRVTGHLCGGVTGEFPTQRPVTRSFDVFFDLTQIKGWVNNGEAGDFRRHGAHYDVIVMFTTNRILQTLGRDLMRERTRSRIQDGGPQKRSGNTAPFLPFNTDFSTRNWYPGKFILRVNTCDIKFNRICPLLLLSSVWNLTQDARTNLIWCANVHCIKTTDARTHIKMR